MVYGLIFYLSSRRGWKNRRSFAQQPAGRFTLALDFFHTSHSLQWKPMWLSQSHIQWWFFFLSLSLVPPAPVDSQVTKFTLGELCCENGHGHPIVTVLSGWVWCAFTACNCSDCYFQVNITHMLRCEIGEAMRGTTVYGFGRACALIKILIWQEQHHEKMGKGDVNQAHLVHAHTGLGRGLTWLPEWKPRVWVDLECAGTLMITLYNGRLSLIKTPAWQRVKSLGLGSACSCC